jgi:4-amino-4-deoxy-L-arabinose transferase-like glycosyltransferase
MSRITSSAPADAVPAAGLPPWTATSFQFLVLLFVYFALHTILRGYVTETAGIDDCDQIIRTQIWSWGYGPQPPLYTWTLKAFLSVFGFNIYTVTALKELALFGIYLLVYFNARLLTGSPFCAIAAAMAVQFNPSISWESHRELTHSVFTSFFILATIYCYLRTATGSWKWFLLLGLCVAGGTLSKYNYLIFFAALLGAGLTLKEWRSRVLSRGMLLALIVAALLCLPHVWWVWEHRELAFSSMHKFKMGETPSWFAAMAKALPKWGTDLVAHVAPMVCIIGLIFATDWKKARCGTAGDQLLWRMLLWILGIVTAAILLFRVTGFRDRWLQPLFVWLPVLFLALYRQHLTTRRYRIIIGLAGAVAVAVLVIAPGRMLFTERLKKNEILNSPFEVLARDLKTELADVDIVVVGDYRVAGNIRLWFPEKFITSPEFDGLFPVKKGNAAMIWDSSTIERPAPDFVQFAERVTAQKLTADRKHFQEPLKYHRSRTMQLTVARME